MRDTMLKRLVGPMLVVSLCGCGQSEPTCDGERTRQLVQNVLTEKKLFFGWGKDYGFHCHNMRTSYCPYRQFNEKQVRELNERYWKAVDAGWSCKTTQECDAIPSGTDFWNEMEGLLQEYKKALKNPKYTLHKIIMTDRNPQTKAVECRAMLRASLQDWGTLERENVTYSVEQTTDGVLTIYLHLPRGSVYTGGFFSSNDDDGSRNYRAYEQ